MFKINEEQKQKFLSMEAEKRDRIINAAMEEFNKGYKKATTDEIVKQAGISKGLLFHYFGSKENLYEFIIEYAIDVMVKEYFALINFEQRDFIERMWQMLLLKIDLSYKYPIMFDFVTTAYKEQKSESLKKLYGNSFGMVSSKIFADIDEGLFRDDIDPKMAINVIYWTHLSYSTAQLERINSTSLKDYQKEYDKFLEEIKAYLSLFKKTFYK
ncbi:MAG: TetR/AcrR family transcriptional regulator [Oscillospiraceae bacterium]|nr:TetR/AcrR family transcriptional regulator [Oscillospiraceae bacterium]